MRGGLMFMLFASLAAAALSEARRALSR